jgi:galactose mutarotase-like enzyme
MSDWIETTWHNFPAIALESAAMRVVIVPNLGAKIVSLYDKEHLLEWLVPPMRPLKQTTYGDDFVSQDMSGWDEMFPTIVACSQQGAALPDHGEVWSVPWQVEQQDGEVVLAISGRALPYRLRRAAALSAPNCLELRYSVENCGQQAFPYLWAAHPQFAADADTRLLLPPEVTQMVNVIDGDPLWGKAGARHDWPEARAADGRAWRMDRVRAPENRACRKFYIPPEQAVGWAALVHEARGCSLRLEWSPQALPYLGLWIDEGAYNSLPAAAFEPSNAYYDSLARAVANGKASVLQPGESQRWTLRVSLG